MHELAWTGMEVTSKAARKAGRKMKKEIFIRFFIVVPMNMLLAKKTGLIDLSLSLHSLTAISIVYIL